MKGKVSRNSMKRQKLDGGPVEYAGDGSLPLLVRVNFPLEVLQLIFGSYLTLKDLLGFDQSMTNYKARKRYLMILKSLVNRPDPEFKHTVASLSWCTSRGIPLRSVRLKRSERSVVSNELVLRIQSRSLTDVSLNACKKLTDKTFCSFVNNNPTLRTCKIDGTKLKNKSLIALGRSCCRLEVLSAACPAISDRGISELARNCSELLSLDVHGTGLTDAGLRVIAECCPLLKHINLAKVECITDEGISMLARHCTNLESIDVSEKSDSSDITDSSLQALAAHCKSLKSINFSDCELITVTGITDIIEKCASVERIYVSNCDEVNGEAIREIARAVTEHGRDTIKLINIKHNAAICLDDATAFKRNCPYVLLGDDWYDNGMDLGRSSSPINNATVTITSITTT